MRSDRLGDVSHSNGEELRRSTMRIGIALAIAISWGLHQSILWATLHGVCGWLYVLYYAITR